MAMSSDSLEDVSRTHLLERLSVVLVNPDEMRDLRQTDGLPAGTSSDNRPGGSPDGAPDCSASSPLDESLAMRLALTADARLQPLGYRLDEKSLRALVDLFLKGVSCDPASIVDRLHPVPDATPMYPDFPTQVMSMDEATYRMHQSLHYLSTYGVEFFASLLGVPGEVRKGWLPDVEATEKVKDDRSLLEAKALTLVFSAEEAAELVWERLVYRNERMTAADVELVCGLPIPATADGSRIAFHENALTLIARELGMARVDAAAADVRAGDASAKTVTPAVSAPSSVADFVSRARVYAAHPGDVIKFIMWLQREMRKERGERSHIPTSAKRRLVALLESFSPASLAENLTLDRERSLRALELVSYNRFSRSPEHLAVVDALRDGNLRSWASKKEEAYRSGDPAAIVAVLSQRPGVMLREVVRMLRVGVPREVVLDAFGDPARLSRATLLNTITRLSVPLTLTDNLSESALYTARRELVGWATHRLGIDLVLVEAGGMRPAQAAESVAPIAWRGWCEMVWGVTSELAGARSGQAWHKPWTAEEETVGHWLGGLVKKYRPIVSAIVGEDYPSPAWMDAELIARVESLVDGVALGADAAVSSWKALRQGYPVRDERLARATQRAVEIRRAVERDGALHDEIVRCCREYLEKTVMVPRRQQRAEAVGIMKELLGRSLAGLTTPLRDARVYVDEQGVDLDRSMVLTNVTRQTSSYFAPGLALKVPEEAQCVRFFVFWDDRTKRVDLDLHAHTDNDVHVGWDGGYSESGLTMSGDVTTSENSVEFLDAYLDSAASAGAGYVTLTLDYFNGGALSDVETAFTGLLVVDDIKPDTRLYTSENVLMRNDLANVGQKMLPICRIDVAHRCVVPLMGGDVPQEASFSAREYLDLLFESQGATLVDERDDADVVLTVGKPVAGELSLVDNGWFAL